MDDPPEPDNGVKAHYQASKLGKSGYIQQLYRGYMPRFCSPARAVAPTSQYDQSLDDLFILEIPRFEFEATGGVAGTAFT